MFYCNQTGQGQGFHLSVYCDQPGQYLYKVYNEIGLVSVSIRFMSCDQSRQCLYWGYIMTSPVCDLITVILWPVWHFLCIFTYIFVSVPIRYIFWPVWALSLFRLYCDESGRCLHWVYIVTSLDSIFIRSIL